MKTDYEGRQIQLQFFDTHSQGIIYVDVRRVLTRVKTKTNPSL